MGFWGAVGSFISGCASVIGSAVSTIGSAVASVATSILSVGTSLLGPVVQAITFVARVLGILKPDEDPEELGAKAMSADKKPEDFESINEYIDYLRYDVQIDKEKLKDADKTTKLASIAIGASITAKGIEERLNANIPIEFWKSVAKQKLEATEIIKTVENYKKNDTNLIEYSEYTEGKSDFSNRVKNQSILVQTYKELEPDLSEDDIEKKVFNMEKKDI